ncbi:MAG: hypothetical protein Q7T50_07940, partial [Candidatus Magasanikbacteria bacterium]|nr:hypothetical protein [Candidatus Magasanikbacteria bacterium]
MYMIIQFVFAASSSLDAPGGNVKCWEYEAGLRHPQEEWTERGVYKFRLLKDEHKDSQFVRILLGTPLAYPGYEIDEIILLSNQADEQVFQACVGLL